MALYEYKLANFSGCFVGIEAVNLKQATDMYKRLSSQLSYANNNVIESVIKKKEEIIYAVKFDETRKRVF